MEKAYQLDNTTSALLERFSANGSFFDRFSVLQNAVETLGDDIEVLAGQLNGINACHGKCSKFWLCSRDVVPPYNSFPSVPANSWFKVLNTP